MALPIFFALDWQAMDLKLKKIEISNIEALVKGITGAFFFFSEKLYVILMLAYSIWLIAISKYFFREVAPQPLTYVRGGEVNIVAPVQFLISFGVYGVS